ncbi:MAG: Na-translocating system protein MpsB, partial [Methylococcales bacterium]|nr:Na-translocating system protein MpsB [Methylococcales bacterium]
MQHADLISDDNRAVILSALAHLNHVLPAQAPLQNFVHHNTLHGYQHLGFEQALADNYAVTGISGYLPEAQYRQFYAEGRINNADINAALAGRVGNAHPTMTTITIDGKDIKHHDILSIALLVDFSAINVSQFIWQVEELNALSSVQADVPAAIAHSYTAQNIRALWEAILIKLDLQQAAYHPETLLDLSLEQTEDWLSVSHSDASIHAQTRQHVALEVDELLAQVGNELSLRGLVLALSGKDSLDFVRPKLIRICASVLDEGVAAWHTPNADKLGLYAAWRASTAYDISLFLHELPDWQQIVSSLPADAIDTIILHLTEMEIPKEKWGGYLQRVALELAGWSGMINWREQHPDYQTEHNTPIHLA